MRRPAGEPERAPRRFVGGPITRALKAAFGLLRYAGPQALLRDRLRAQAAGPEAIRRRAEAVEWYILGWLMFDAALFLAVGPGGMRDRGALWAAALIACLRAVDILQAAVNVAIFDPLDRPPGEHLTASTGRALVLGFLNYVEFILLFAVLYAAFLPRLRNAGGWDDAVYFSLVTQTTLGYGDLIPTGFLRWVAAAQGLLGITFPVLIIARFVGALPGIREGGRE